MTIEERPHGSGLRKLTGKPTRWTTPPAPSSGATGAGDTDSGRSAPRSAFSGYPSAHAIRHHKFLAFRQAVAERFEIPWTAIAPRMQRLLYAINAIAQPQVRIAAGVFCGNTIISNAGAAVGQGACTLPKPCWGEIKPDEAERAECNVRSIDPTGVARVVHLTR